MSRYFYILPLLLFSVACKKDPSVWQISNLNGNRISVFGHGGMGINYRYPMNSMRSLNDVLAEGADGTEMDITLTNDNVLVLYHDNRLEDGTGCDGRIRGHSWDEIKDCRYKMPLLDRAKLIRATDFFGQRSDLQSFVFTFDCKVSDADDKDYQANFATALYQLIQDHKIAGNSFIESYSVPFLKLLQAQSKDLKLFLHPAKFENALDAMSEVDLFGVTIDRTKISAAQVEKAHSRGLRVTIYNLDHEGENLDGIALSPDFMQTDKCGYLLNALK